MTNFTDAERAELAAKINQLPEPQRRLCQMLLDGRTRDDICAELGVSPAALALRLSRARMALASIA